MKSTLHMQGAFLYAEKGVNEVGYVVNFTDNAAVTGTYLNTTASELGGGVLTFTDDMTYGVDDLNDISAELITKGVTRGCGLSVSGTKVTIAAGVLYMCDGRRVEIDSDGVLLDFTAGAVNYVWFYHDAVTGFAAPRCTTTAPTGDHYVMLGQITAEGTAVSRPEVARMKNTFLGTNKTESVTKSFSWSKSQGTDEALLWEISLSGSGYNSAVVSSGGYVTESNQVYNAFCGVVHFGTKQAYTVLQTLQYGSGNTAYGHSLSSTEGKVLAAYTAGGGSRECNVYLRFVLGNDKVLRVYRSAYETGSAGYDSMHAIDITIRLC